MDALAYCWGTPIDYFLSAPTYGDEIARPYLVSGDWIDQLQCVSLASTYICFFKALSGGATLIAGHDLFGVCVFCSRIFHLAVR